MAGLFQSEVRIDLAVAPGDDGAPELATLRDWADLTPAVTLAILPTPLSPGASVELRLRPGRAKRPALIMAGWPRGYEFVSLMQSAYLLSMPGQRMRHNANGAAVALYTAPTCPHSPIQLRHLMRVLERVGTDGPLLVFDVTQAAAPPDAPSVGEVPLTVLRWHGQTAARSGVQTESEIADWLQGASAET
jgi:hypothetical protein